MSGKIYINNTHLVAEVSTPAVCKMIVEDQDMENVEIVAQEGVAFNFDVETGELTLTSNNVGSYEITVGFEGEEPQDVILFETTSAKVEEYSSVEEQPTKEEPKVEEVVVETPVAANEETPLAPPAVEDKPVVVPTSKATLDLMAALNEYKTKMGLKCAVDVALGTVQQQKLYRAIIRVLDKPETEFNENMDALINFVRENRNDVFNEKAINRFIPQVKLNKDEILLFTRLTTLLIITADIDNKKLVSSRVDFKYIEQKLNNAEAMRKLRNYYDPTTE